MTITIDIKPETESRVRVLAAAEGTSPESFLSTLIEKDIQELSFPDGITAEDEAHLLQQINRGFTEEQWQRYHQLRSKLQDGSLSDEEHQELLQLSDHREMQNVQRLAMLAQLAQMRGVS